MLGREDLRQRGGQASCRLEAKDLCRCVISDGRGTPGLLVGLAFRLQVLLGLVQLKATRLLCQE